jgi:hypothetical protein
MKKIFPLCVAILLSVSAFAKDGVVSINQGTVMAAGGFPYKITQSGSYMLSGNLVVPANVDGIDISADGVLLDLNGFTIKGPGTCNAASGPPTQCSGNSGFAEGILIFGDNVTVRNGSVEGMAVGVFGGSLIEEVHVSNNLEGIQAGEAVVRRCTAHNNSTGIELFSSGVAEANDVSRNQYGLDVQQGTAIGNSVNNNTIGFQPRNSVYGSNSFQNNGTDIAVFGAVVNVSQNNNICTAGQC